MKTPTNKAFAQFHVEFLHMLGVLFREEEDCVIFKKDEPFLNLLVNLPLKVSECKLTIDGLNDLNEGHEGTVSLSYKLVDYTHGGSEGFEVKVSKTIGIDDSALQATDADQGEDHVMALIWESRKRMERIVHVFTEFFMKNLKKEQIAHHRRLIAQTLPAYIGEGVMPPFQLSWTEEGLRMNGREIEIITKR